MCRHLESQSLAYALVQLGVFSVQKLINPFRPGTLGGTTRLFPLDNVTAQAHGADREQFFVDAAAGTLPQYSFIDVNGTFDSQENPQNVVNGEAFMSSVVQALGASPQWNKTLLIIN